MSLETTTAPAGPYKGLAAFDDSDLDALLFFGRARETKIVAANVLASRLTVLYGPSGVGKSSLLRAGVVRSLRDAGGFAAPAVSVYGSWTGDPLSGLEEAARAAVREALGRDPADAPGALTDRLASWSAELGAELCLILDQLEELFLYHPAADGAGGFVDLLPELVTRPGLHVNVLLGIRDDALAQLDVFKGRIPGLFANSLRLDHLDREAAREAILGPLERYNAMAGEARAVSIEPKLVEAVLDEVAAGRIESRIAGRGAVEGSGELGGRVETPYLQLVLQRVWEVERERGSDVLRLSTFVDLGGAQRIVEDHLERALAALTPSQQDTAATVFGHLVTPSGMKVAHGVDDLATYAAVGERDLEPVLRSLAHERILRPLGENGHGAGGRYEIFHDVLGDAVLAWRTAHERSRALEHERELARRRHRRALVVAVVALIALAAMTALAIYALSQRDEAQQQADIAQRQQQAAQSQARVARARALDATASALLDVNPERGVGLALSAAELSPSAQSETVLRRALRSARLSAIFPALGPVTEATYSGDGRHLLIASKDGRARLYDAASHRRLRVFSHGAPILAAGLDHIGRVVATAGEDGRTVVWQVDDRSAHALSHGAKVRDVAVSPDGRLVVSAGGRTVKEWRADDGSLVGTLEQETPVVGVTFSPDGRYFATVSRDSLARLYDASSASLVGSFDQGGRVNSVWFATHRDRLVTSGQNRTARLWSLSGDQLSEFVGHVGPVTKAVMSPRGQFLATVSTDGSGRLWDVQTGTVVTPLIGHTNPLDDIAFGPTGFTVVTASRDGTARVWKSDNGDELALLAGHRGPVRRATFSPDGLSVLTGSDDGTARLWNVAAQPRLGLVARDSEPMEAARYVGRGELLVASGTRASLLRSRDGKSLQDFDHGASIADVAVSPDGSRVAIVGGGHLSLFDRTTGNRVDEFSHPGAGTAIAFASDGHTFATGSAEGVSRIWSLAGKVIHEFGGHRAAITDVAFDAPGSRLATASRDGTARLWNLRTSRGERTLVGHNDDVNSVAFSPDGTEVLTAGNDHDAILWNARTGAIRQRLVWHFGGVNDAEFSPDGRWIVTAGPKTAQLWEPASLKPFLRYGLGGHDAPLTSATFDPTSRVVLTSSVDGTVRRYVCRLCGGLGALRAIARAHIAAASQGLTPAQKRKYLG
jgi:WD40 repeat protein